MPLDEQTAKARAMSESDLFTEVATILKRCGWRYHHVPATAYRKNHIRSGFPDIIAIKDWHLLAIELKRESEKVLPETEQWEWAIAFLRVQAGSYHAVRYVEWRPSDLLAGRIDEVLAS